MTGASASTSASYAATNRRVDEQPLDRNNSQRDNAIRTRGPAAPPQTVPVPRTGFASATNLSHWRSGSGQVMDGVQQISVQESRPLPNYHGMALTRATTTSTTTAATTTAAVEVDNHGPRRTDSPRRIALQEQRGHTASRRLLRRAGGRYSQRYLPPSAPIPPGSSRAMALRPVSLMDISESIRAADASRPRHAPLEQSMPFIRNVTMVTAQSRLLPSSDTMPANAPAPLALPDSSRRPVARTQLDQRSRTSTWEPYHNPPSPVDDAILDYAIDIETVDNDLVEAPSANHVTRDPSDPFFALPHVRRQGMDGPLVGFRPRTDFLPNTPAPTAVPLCTAQDVANEEMTFQLGQAGKVKEIFDTKDDPNVPDIVKGGAIMADGWGNTFVNVEHRNEQRCVGCLVWFSAALFACPSCETPVSGAAAAPTNGNGSATQGAASGSNASSGAPSSGSTTSGFVFGVQPSSTAGSSVTPSTGGFVFAAPPAPATTGASNANSSQGSVSASSRASSLFAPAPAANSATPTFTFGSAAGPPAAVAPAPFVFGATTNGSSGSTASDVSAAGAAVAAAPANMFQFGSGAATGPAPAALSTNNSSTGSTTATSSTRLFAPSERTTKEPEGQNKKRRGGDPDAAQAEEKSRRTESEHASAAPQASFNFGTNPTANSSTLSGGLSSPAPAASVSSTAPASDAAPGASNSSQASAPAFTFGQIRASAASTPASTPAVGNTVDADSSQAPTITFGHAPASSTTPSITFGGSTSQPATLPPSLSNASAPASTLFGGTSSYASNASLGTSFGSTTNSALPRPPLFGAATSNPVPAPSHAAPQSTLGSLNQSTEANAAPVPAFQFGQAASSSAAQNSAPAPFNPFHSSASNNTSSSGFGVGNPTSAPGTGFGASNPAPIPVTGFGANNTPATSSGFGGTTNVSAGFGAASANAPSAGLFGTSNTGGFGGTNPLNPPGGFGSTNASNPQGFGSTNSANLGGFGSSDASNPGGFGSSGASNLGFGAPAPSAMMGFPGNASAQAGSMPPAQNSAGNLQAQFGWQNASVGSFGNPATQPPTFGAAQPPSFGVGAVPAFGFGSNAGSGNVPPPPAFGSNVGSSGSGDSFQMGTSSRPPSRRRVVKAKRPV
jgi:hypothetical protein